jgi:hypothetical protein
MGGQLLALVADFAQALDSLGVTGAVERALRAMSRFGIVDVFTREPFS